MIIDFSSSSYNIIATIVALAVLTIGSISDFKKREVADMVNYGLFCSAIALRLIYATITLDPMVIVSAAAGFIVTMIIALTMFYAGQWGGGDAKMIMGLGILFGLPIMPLDGLLIWNSLLISFIINMFIAGSVFGLIWSIVVAFKNKDKFITTWKIESKKAKTIKLTSLIIGAVLLAIAIFMPEIRMLMFPLIILVVLIGYIYIFAKSVEKGTMVLMLSPKDITEGDWIEKEVKHKGRYICGPKDLGITKKQIALLKKLKIKKIPVKIGIPFIPAFFLGYIMALIFGNFFTFFITMII
ncbi:prepilin peptidase [Candidatus Woesearchaeota archaeon]|nr:prepilin peptidase [Candidatus Woesearchaeota archaeon]